MNPQLKDAVSDQLKPHFPPSSSDFYSKLPFSDSSRSPMASCLYEFAVAISFS
jgi:hypothetical protein